MQVRPEDQRQLSDVIWDIAEQRRCDEVFIRYDCGHCLRADVWAPVLPKTREYANQDPDRRRFLQHSLFVLTKTPGVQKVQITVPEGRCRCCGRGQRQALYCGTLQMDLVGGYRTAPSVLGRLELPLHSATFLAVMGKVCQLPDNVVSPPLLQNSDILQESVSHKPIERQDCHQWSRREIEDEVSGEVVKYVGGTLFLLLFMAFECMYFCVHYFADPTGSENSSNGIWMTSNSTASSVAAELRNLTSVSPIELMIANSTWMLSSLQLSFHKILAPAPAPDVSTFEPSWMWTKCLHPFWICMSIALTPILWAIDLLMALPSFLFEHAVLTCWRLMMGRPWNSLLGLFDLLYNAGALAFQCIFIQRPASLSQVPVTNPMLVAIVLSLVFAIISGPQSGGLPIPGVWNDLPITHVQKGAQKGSSSNSLFGPIVQRLSGFWGSSKKSTRSKNGSAGKTGQKGGSDRSSARDGTGRAQAGRHDGKMCALSGKASQPACFLCLDRPSAYILEPCGHRVVCGECAIQLVEAASRNRIANEGPSAQHASEKGGGTCPSCSMSITRAMRIFT